MLQDEDVMKVQQHLPPTFSTKQFWTTSSQTPACLPFTVHLLRVYERECFWREPEKSECLVGVFIWAFLDKVNKNRCGLFGLCHI